MPSARAYTATSATAPLTPGTLHRREVGPRDVLVDIAWVGICHSDIHTVRGEWGTAPYPLTVGHEIVGVVAEVGAEVTRHHVGDRVGVGCLVDSCRDCDHCRADQEQFCRKGAMETYGSTDRNGSITQGGYATRIVVDEHFVLRVPSGIPFETAAPLLCAGITTYSPLRRWNAGPGRRVAVVGLGGLGHLAVKLAHAMGAEVTVLSRTAGKRDDAGRLGARHFHATSDPETFDRLESTFDLIINTVSAEIDLNAYLSLLDLDGTLVNVGAPPHDLTVSLFTLLPNRRSFAGSLIGGLRETQEMLDFCAAHRVIPEVEIIAADQINDAWARVLDSDVRYRFVIDISTMTH
ncbi:NAD(P)-dependent alcohol dehydrogenase [Streptomyces scopuliridis]|uniref:NAD(P)-dependent alcohol dehydrogenase n=1 Tax=Streptomyces scopuliridis TaxID=452529 RepID=UPI003432A32C